MQAVQEFPAIRFRAAKPTGDDPVLEARALVAQRVAIEIHDRLIALQKAGVVSDAGDASAHARLQLHTQCAMQDEFRGCKLYLFSLSGCRGYLRPAGGGPRLRSSGACHSRVVINLTLLSKSEIHKNR